MPEDRMSATNHDLKKTQQANDSAIFWIVSHATALTDVLYALYYLPVSYRLLVLDAADTQDMGDHVEIIDRVQFASAERLGTAPLSFAHAVISGQVGKGKLVVSVSDLDTPRYT